MKNLKTKINNKFDKKNIDSVLKLKTTKHKPIKLFKSLQESDSGITSSDYIGVREYVFANGAKATSRVFNLKQIKIGDFILSA